MTKARVNADNASADIQGVTAGTGLSGGGTSGTVTLTNDMATAIDAKGDLVVGTGADTYSRLATGNNGDTLLADSSASTGLRWQPNFCAGKNAIINGDFRIWQRGTSFTTVNTYTVDRFDATFDGTGGTRTVSQQTFTPGTAPVAGYEGLYFYRYNKSVGGTGGTVDYILRQKIEDVRTFAGQTVTLSFWAKANTTLTINTVLSQNFGSGGSTSVEIGYTSHNLTTSWQRFTMTQTLGSMSGKTIGTNSFLMPYLYYLNTNGTFTIDVWGVQLEAGNTATAFETATGTLAGELAACQRYYYRMTSLNNLYESFGFGMANNGTTGGNIQCALPVTMRTAPTSLDFSTLRISDFANGYAVTTLTLDGNHNSRWVANLGFSVASGLTAYRPYSLQSNNSNSGYVGFSAEL